MAMVPYDRGAYLRMYEMELTGISGGEMASDDSNGPTVSARLQAMLQSAREANESDGQQLPLEDLLARLRQEELITTAAQEKEIKASLYGEACGFASRMLTKQLSVAQLISTTLLKALENLTNFRGETTPVSQATQTDIESPYVQQLLAEATNKAYERGFLAGKEERIRVAVAQGKLSGKSDRLITGSMQRRAEDREEGEKLEPQCGFNKEEQIGLENGVAEGVKGENKAMGRVREADFATCGPNGQVRKKVVVKMPPVPLNTGLKTEVKENGKPVNDPFQSLLGLMRRK